MLVLWLKRKWPRLLVHAAGLGPLLLLVGYYLTEVLVNPVRYTILRSGTLGLVFLVATLACTPARRFLGWSWAIQVRRSLGLYSFLYMALHLWGYLAWENSFYFDLIWRDLGERRAMPLGIAAFLLLVPLALTSTRGWQRRLGKRWRALHRLVYLAALLSVWHYLWLDRDFKTWPWIFTAVVGLLLAARLPFVRSLTRKSLPAD